MNDSQSIVTSDLPSSLNEIDAAILRLESQRAEILREHLEHAEQRIANLQSNASDAAPARGRGAKKKRAGKKGVAKKRAAKKKAGKRAKVAKGDRLALLTSVVRGAGKSGISAKQAGERAGIPYSAARAILSESDQFRREGEKRDSRFFLS